jgi:hormone-sensitive lipase
MMEYEVFDSLLLRVGEALRLDVETMTTLQHAHPHFSDLMELLIQVLRQLQSSAFVVAEQRTTEVYISTRIGSHYLEAVLKYCADLEECCNGWKKIAYLSLDDEKDLKVILSKFSALNVMLVPSMRRPAEDLFCVSHDDDRWTKAAERVETIQATNPTALEDSINKMVKMMLVSSAFLSKGLEYSGTMMRNIMTGTGVLYYGLRQEEAAKQAKINAAAPTLEFARRLWGINESQLASSVFDSLIVNIAVSQLIYIPRVAAHVSERKASDILLTAKQITNSSSFVKTPEPHSQRVPVRIISSFRLPGISKKESVWGFCCAGREPEIPPHEAVENIVFHIHGGGWISMSSRCHENYTRRWALQIKVAILSVDYRLAPEFPYPAGLDDVWQAYVWTIKYAKKQLGII